MTAAGEGGKGTSKSPVKAGKLPGKHTKAQPAKKWAGKTPAGRNSDTASAASSKKSKSKNSKPKRKKKKAVVKVDKSRDFTGDLETYLEEWAGRETEGSSWKFNKILQAWALKNCFIKRKVGSPLFKQLIPYILTVQGGAMDRLVSRAAAIMSTDKCDIVDDDVEAAPKASAVTDELGEEGVEEPPVDEVSSGKVTKSMVSRAKKIQKALNA